MLNKLDWGTVPAKKKKKDYCTGGPDYISAESLPQETTQMFVLGRQREKQDWM